MTDRSKVRFYLAGPFFNAAQIEVINTLERFLDMHGYPYFSPRKMALNGNPTSAKPNREQAEQIFRKDYQEICNCTHMLAVIDWAMNPNTSIRVCRDPAWGEVPDDRTPGGHVAKLHATLSEHLAIPDSGTVWEMGCAYALRVPVYAYTERPANKMNLMLTQSARGVVYGPEALAAFLNYDLDEACLGQWKGDFR